MDEVSSTIHTWQNRASSSVHAGGLLNTYLATTWANTATVRTAKRVTTTTSTERRVPWRAAPSKPVASAEPLPALTVWFSIPAGPAGVRAISDSNPQEYWLEAHCLERKYPFCLADCGAISPRLERPSLSRSTSRISGIRRFQLRHCTRRMRLLCAAFQVDRIRRHAIHSLHNAPVDKKPSTGRPTGNLIRGIS